MRWLRSNLTSLKILLCVVCFWVECNYNNPPGEAPIPKSHLGSFGSVYLFELYIHLREPQEDSVRRPLDKRHSSFGNQHMRFVCK